MDVQYEETAYLMASPKNAERLCQAVAEIEAGKMTNKDLEIQAWQINEIGAAIAEADSEQLVDHDTVIKYWQEKRALPPPKPHQH